MTFDPKQAALSAFLQEAKDVRDEIARIQSTQRRLAFSSITVAGAIIPSVAVFTGLFKENAFVLPELAVYPTMAISLLATIIVLLYAGLSFGIARLAEYLVDSLNPKINSLIDTSAGPAFFWESWLKIKKRQSVSDFVIVAIYPLSEIVCLFIVACLYHFVWIYFSYKQGLFSWIHSLFILFTLALIAIVAYVCTKTVREARKVPEIVKHLESLIR